MKPYQIVLTVITVLALNNLALLSFTGYFSEKKSTAIEVTSNASDITLIEPQSSNDNRTSNSKTSLVSDLSQQNQAEMAQAVDNYIRSEQFSSVINEWQRKSRKRNQEISARLSKMGADELYTLTVESENAHEKNAAFYQLTQSNKYKQLSNEELKGLYVSDTDNWAKEKLLNALLERDDSDAIDWAKELITVGQASKGTGSSELYSTVYEKDPEFIKNHIATIEFDDTSVSHDLLSFLLSEPDLASSYLSRNFDQIIRSQNDDVFLYGAYGANLDLSQQQQLDLTELLTSRNKRKRGFAMDLAQNIDDTQALRNAYATLSRYREKLQFIGGLLQADKNTKQFTLGKELAADSNDPNIKQLADNYKP